VYSQSKVNQKLDMAEAKMGWRAARHSIADIISFEDHLKRHNKYKLDEEGKINGLQNITPDEHQWMLNDQVLCTCDAEYYLTRFCFLKNEQNIIERFKMRVPQKLYFDIICDLEERDAAIEVLALKARQLGVSIFSELLISQRIVFSYGVISVIGSADQTKTSEMSQMLILAYDMLPYWLRPSTTSRVESDRGKLMFGGTASGVRFQHGQQKFGIGTGSTPTLYHLSEVALYPDPVKIIDEGLWKAVHASPGVFGVLESTGRGSEGWWADTWRYSKSKWPNSRMCPMFLPWYAGTDIYPTTTDMRTRPVPVSWRPARDTREHVAKAQLYVRSSPLLSKHLGTDWRMPIEQQWYWEWNHEEAKFKGNEASFYQEMAGDDEEALQRSSESVFGHEVLLTIDTSRQRAYDCFTLTGQSIEDSHEVAPEHFDYTRERIPVMYQSHKQTSRWELIPLKPVALNETSREDAEAILCVWEHPKPGINYAIGVDTSSGKGEDSSVVSVWALGYGAMPDVQVAEYASSWVSHVESFAFILCIAAFYARYMNEGKTRWKEPYVTIEQVEAVGDVAQHQMGLLGYTNFHKMPRYDQSLRRINKMKKGAAKPGWYTWGWSRPILIDTFVHWVKHGWAKVNSPWLIEEMRHFEVHLTARGKERLEHEDGENDDRIFGAALSIFPPHDVEPMSHRSKNRIEVASAMPKLDLSPFRGNVLPADVLTDNYRPMTLEDVIYSSPRGRR
jgi:hypothetical protein